MLDETELRIDTGHPVDGRTTWMRVRHRPSGVQVEHVLDQGETMHQVKARLVAEVESELRSRGLLQYLEEP